MPRVPAMTLGGRNPVIDFPAAPPPGQAPRKRGPAGGHQRNGGEGQRRDPRPQLPALNHHASGESQTDRCGGRQACQREAETEPPAPLPQDVDSQVAKERGNQRAFRDRLRRRAWTYSLLRRERGEEYPQLAKEPRQSLRLCWNRCVVLRRRRRSATTEPAEKAQIEDGRQDQREGRDGDCREVHIRARPAMRPGLWPAWGGSFQARIGGGGGGCGFSAAGPPAPAIPRIALAGRPTWA